MTSVVADTHAAIWYLSQSRRLSDTACQAMRQAMASGYPVLVSTISIVEMVYLTERNRLERSALERLEAVLKDPTGGFKVVPVDYHISRSVEHIARESIPDMPDRIIAATALVLGLPLVTCDGRLRQTRIQTIW